MKNIRLIALVFLNSLPFFHLHFCLSFSDFKIFAEDKSFWNKSHINLSLEASNLSDTENINAAGGGSIKLSFAEFTGFYNEQGINLEGTLSSQELLKKHLLILKAGALTYSGSVSKLHNPLISTSVSPFSLPACNANNMTSKSPGLSSSKISNSLFCYWEFNDSGKKVSKTTFPSITKFNITNMKFVSFYIPNDKTAANLLIKFNCGKYNLGFSTATEIYNCQAYSYSSWFSKDWNNYEDFYYHADLLFDSVNQFSFSSRNFSSLFTIGLYESPFGKININFKSENKGNIGKINLHAAAFLNKNEFYTITGSEKRISDMFQVKAGGVYNFTVKKTVPYFVKAGSTFYLKNNLLALSSNDSTSELKWSLGEQITSPFLRHSIIFTFTGDFTQTLIEASKYDLLLKSCFYLNKMTPSFTVDFSYEKNSNSISTAQKIKLGSSFLENPVFTFSSTFSFTEKDFIFESMDWNLSVSAKYGLKKITGLIKLKS